MNQKVALTILVLAVSALIAVPTVNALSKPAVEMDSWRVLCPAAADGGVEDILDEVDGGTHLPYGYAAFHVTNESTTCINVGSNGSGDADPVDSNTGIEVGSGCAAGMTWGPDIRPTNLACQSQGAAALLRVSVVKE